MRAGQRNQKVTIERYTVTRGDYGEELQTWATLSSQWVNIKSVSGGEPIRGGKVDSQTSHLITLRETDITTKDRIVHGTRIFNISRVISDEGRGFDQQVLVFEDV